MIGNDYMTVVCVEGPSYYVMQGTARIGKDCARISGDNFALMEMPAGGMPWYYRMVWDQEKQRAERVPLSSNCWRNCWAQDSRKDGNPDDKYDSGHRTGRNTLFYGRYDCIRSVYR